MALKQALTAIFATILGLTNIEAHRENVYFLRGYLGGTEVGLRIDAIENYCNAYYFKTGELTETALVGEIDEKGQFLFHIPSHNTEPNRPNKIVLNIHETSNHTWKGLWVETDETICPVSFKPINIDSLQHPNLVIIKKYNIDPYTALRTSHLKFITPKKQKIKGGYTITFLKDNLVGIESFRLNPPKSNSSLYDSINGYWDFQHLKQIENYLSCTKNIGPTGYSSQSTIHYLNDKLISYTTTTTSNCYGINEIVTAMHHNTNIASAQPFELEDLFYMGEKPSKPYAVGSEEWYNCRYKIFGPKIIELLSSMYASQMTSNKLNGCNYNDIRNWQFPTWHIAKEGLFIGSISVAGNTVCDEPNWAIVPWKLLTPYWNSTIIPLNQ